MRRFSLSLTISILLHLTLIFLFISFFSGIKAKKQNNKINISQITIKKIPKERAIKKESFLPAIKKKEPKIVKKAILKPQKKPKENLSKELKEVKQIVPKIQKHPKHNIAKKPKKFKKVVPKKSIKRVKKSSKKIDTKKSFKKSTKSYQKRQKIKNSLKKSTKNYHKIEKRKDAIQNSQSNSIHKPIFDTSKILNAINQEKFYPIMAKKRRIEGVVVVKFTLYQNGSIKILNISSAHPILQKASREIILKASRYFPKPTAPITISAPIEFRLEY